MVLHPPLCRTYIILPDNSGPGMALIPYRYPGTVRVPVPTVPVVPGTVPGYLYRSQVPGTVPGTVPGYQVPYIYRYQCTSTLLISANDIFYRVKNYVYC